MLRLCHSRRKGIPACKGIDNNYFHKSISGVIMLDGITVVCNPSETVMFGNCKMLDQIIAVWEST